MAKYKQIKLVDTSLGKPKDFHDVEASTFGELKAAIAQLDHNFSFNNKAVVVKDLNINLELDEAVLPEAENLILFCMTKVIKGAADSSSTVGELRAEAKKLGVTGYSSMNKTQLLEVIENTMGSSKATKGKTKEKVAAVVESVKTSKSSKKSVAVPSDSEDNSIKEQVLKQVEELRNKLTPILSFINTKLSTELTSKLDEIVALISKGKLDISNYKLFYDMNTKAEDLLREANKISDVLKQSNKR